MKKIVAGFGNNFQLIRLIVAPFILATPPAFIWHYLFINGWHSTSIADEPIVNAIIPGLFVLYGIIAGFMLTSGSEDIRKMKHAVRVDDKATFIEIAEDSTSIPMRFVLFTSGKIILIWIISLNYEIYWTGLASVYSNGYLFALIWEVIADFDDPVNGMWVIKGVPHEWIKEANTKQRVSDRFFEWLIAKITAP